MIQRTPVNRDHKWAYFLRYWVLTCWYRKSQSHSSIVLYIYYCEIGHICAYQPHKMVSTGNRWTHLNKSMVSCQKGPTRHAYAWQIGPFWQDTLEIQKQWITLKCMKHNSDRVHFQWYKVHADRKFHSARPASIHVCISVQYIMLLSHIACWSVN